MEIFPVKPRSCQEYPLLILLFVLFVILLNMVGHKMKYGNVKLYFLFIEL